LSNVKRIFSPRGLLLLFGYALYKAVAYNSYTTGFSLAGVQVGYIFNTSFLNAATAGILVTALIGTLVFWQRLFKPLSMGFVFPGALLIASYAFARTLAPLLNPTLALALLGFAWGVATTVLPIVWLEALAYNSTLLLFIFRIAFASLISALGALLLPAGLGIGNAIICSLLLVASLFALCWCRKTAVPYVPEPGNRATVNALRQAAVPMLGCLFFGFIIGMINMYGFTSETTQFVTARTPLFGMTACAILTCLFVLFTTKLPKPSGIYLGVFSAIIAAFLLLPFFWESLGEQFMALFYAGYVFATLIATLYLVEAIVQFKADFYCMNFFAAGIIRITQLAGLAIGYFFGTMQEGDDFIHLTFLAVVSAYCLGTAIVFGTVHSARAHQKAAQSLELELASLDEQLGEQQARAHEALKEGFEGGLRARADELAIDARLTSRECDVLVRLALGHSAKTIANDLCLSTSTVYGYVKNIYAKLNINKKQQVISLFSDTIPTPEPFQNNR